MTPSLRLPLRSDKLKFFRAARGYADKAEVDYEEVYEEIGAFLFENEFEGDFLRDLDSATRTWWNGLKGKFKEAFGAVGGTEGADAHDAVRELMKAFEEGRGVKSEEGTEGGNTSVGFSGENGRGSEYSSGNGMGTRSAFEEGERWSAAAMNRTGTIPDGKSLQEVVSGIMQNNSVSVKGNLSKDVSAVADFWSETSSTSARRALSGVLLAAIPEEMRSVKLKDGRVVEITLNGIANILQHMPNVKGAFRNGALEFILHLPEFLSSAEEFYREFKGAEHCNFGGIVDFKGTEFYVSVTCTSAGNSLRVKAVNSIKKSSLDAWTETTTAEKRGSSSESVLRAASKLDMADVLKWLFLNQEKTVGDFDSWMRSNRARLEEAEARKRQSERQSRVRPGVGLDVSRNGMNERKGSADIRWSIRRKEQEAWNAVLDAYEAGTLPQRGMNVVLGRTPVVLQRCGAEDLPIKISKSVLDKVVSEKHGISVSELRKLLTNIDDPIAVFRSRTQENSLVVLTEIIDEKNGDNAIVAIRLDAKESGGGHEINAVSSIYGKKAFSIHGMMQDGLAVYANQKKSRAYLRSKRLQLPPEASKRGNLSLLTEEDFSDDALGEIKVNPESFGERQSRSYRAADTQEQEYQRNADAAILAVYKLVGGAVSEKCKWLRTLPEWEQAAVVNRSEIICKFARLRLGTKGPVSISQARRAVLSASSFDIDRLKNAIVFDSVTNGVYVERRARAKLSDELALMEAQGAEEGRGLTLSTDLSDESVRLGEALTGSQGAGAAIRGSAQTLTERAGALRPLLRDAAKRFGLEEGALESAVVEALAAAAERASLPAEHVAKLRAVGNALGSEEFEAETDAGV